MKRGYVALLLMSVCLVSCGESEGESNVTNTPILTSTDSYVLEAVTQNSDKEKKEQVEQEESTKEPELLYFQYDKEIDAFFTEYNSISKNKFKEDQISKGNVRTKANARNKKLSLEIAHVNDFDKPYIEVSIYSNYKDEDTVLYNAFVDVMKVECKDLSKKKIKKAWDKIHKSGYMVEDYDFNGINISYVPHIDTQEYSEPRIDLIFPTD